MTCKICNSSNLKIITEQDGWKLYRCKDCGFVYKYGVTIQYEELPASYYNVYNFDRTKEVEEIIEIIKKYYKNLSQVNLIEIGSGTGILLNEFQKRCINVFGYEPSSIAVEISKNKFGLENVKAEYFIGNTFNVHPNVFLLYDVIEHLEDPKSLFELVKNSMKNDTIFIIKSGNPSSINARLFPRKWGYFLIPEHLAFYSESAMDKLCETSGLNLKKFYKFKHAYGGFALKILISNFIKSIILRASKIYPALYKKLDKRFGVNFANDHYIAVIKIK